MHFFVYNKLCIQYICALFSMFSNVDRYFIVCLLVRFSVYRCTTEAYLIQLSRCFPLIANYLHTSAAVLLMCLMNESCYIPPPPTRITLNSCTFYKREGDRLTGNRVTGDGEHGGGEDLQEVNLEWRRR